MSSISMSVASWLGELGLDSYVAVFEENAIDIDVLADLTDADLASMGVLLGHRKKILKAAGALYAPGLPSNGRRQEAGQKRQVTVLFADLCGYTRLSIDLGAEEMHRLLNGYFEAVDAVVEDYGGVVDKHIGDCVMAVFGAPVAHSDDPERAIRAAADIHRAMPMLTERMGVPLQAHIGVASGQVVASLVGSNHHVEYTITGESVNLASRLDDLAKPGETLVSGAVRRSTMRVAEFTAQGEVTVEGFDEAVPVWVFDRLRDAPLASGVPDLIGRNSELRQLSALAESVLEDHSGHILLLRGEAGVGKSRLVREFIERSAPRDFAVHRSHIVDFGAKRGPRILRDLVAGLVGLAPDAHVGARLKMHRRLIADGVVADAHAAFLFDLLDLVQPESLRGAYAAMPADQRLTGIRETLGALVSAVSAVKPRLIVIEDVHWADGPTLKVLTGLAARLPDCPAMLLMTSRAEGWTLSTDFVASLRGCPLTTIELQPLKQGDAIRLAAMICPGREAEIQRLVERADGNPLYLEQMVSALSDGGNADLPDTIHALVLARTDRLPEADKAALTAAAVLGDRFSLEALRELISAATYGCENLIEHRLVRVEGDELVFSHALIRDGVYASLLRDRRDELHLRAAQHYRERDLTLHAEHLDRARAPSAPGAFLAAAREQMARVQYDTARRLATRGSETAAGAERFALSMILGDLAHRFGDTAEMIVQYQLAVDVAENAADRCRARIGVAEAHRITDRYDDLMQTLEAALREAEGLSLAKERSRVHQLLGGVSFVRGDIEACLAANNRSLDFAQQAGSRELEAQALGNLGDAEFAAGRMISAHERFDACISLSEEHGLYNVIAANQSMRGQALLYLCRPHEALADSQGALALAGSQFNPRAEVVALLVGVYVLELIDAAAAGAMARKGIELADRIGATRFKNVFQEYLGRVAAIENDWDTAEQLVAGAVEDFRKSESNMLFLGGRALGSLALVSRESTRRRALLEEGEKLLVRGVGAHNPLWFYRDAIEVALDMGDWALAERYANLLATYTSRQPLPWSRFFATRGRALARAGRGKGEEAELHALCEEARHIGFNNTITRIETFL